MSICICVCTYVRVIVYCESTLVGLSNRSQEMLEIPSQEHYNKKDNRTGPIDDKWVRTVCVTTLHIVKNNKVEV
jgi:hypothetical protein